MKTKMMMMYSDEFVVPLYLLREPAAVLRLYAENVEVTLKLKVAWSFFWDAVYIVR
jgi:hypothetical protein